MESILEYHRYLRDLKLLFHLELYKTIMGDRSVTNIFLSVHTFPQMTIIPWEGEVS